MKNSTSIILLTANKNVVLQHRDDIPNIEYPDFWGLIGGWIEENETPEEAIKRELEEELYLTDKKENLRIGGLRLVDQRKREKGWTEFIFLGNIKNDIFNLRLKEGQKISSFNFQELQILKLANHHKEYINRYLKIKIDNKMKKIEEYLTLNELGDVKDYKALEIGDGYILSNEEKPIGVFHTKEDAKIIALLIFKENVPRGFHYHLEKIEYMTVLSGKLKCEFSLPESDEKMELILNEGQQVKILPGCIHTYTALEKDVYAIEYAPNRYKESDVIVVK